MPRILGRDQVALKGIMGVATPAAVEEGGDEVGIVQSVDASDGYPRYDSTLLPGEPIAGAAYSMAFDQHEYNTTSDNAGRGAIEVPYTASMNTTEYTVSAWIRKSGADSHNRAVWAMGAGGYSNGSGFYIWNNQTAYWNISDGGSGEYIAMNSPASFNNDTWYHVVCTKAADGTNCGIMYINGTAQSAKHSIASYTVNPSGAFGIGQYVNGSPQSGEGNPDRSWIGNIAEVAVWNAALNAGGVAALYSGGDGAIADTVSGSNLVAYYRFSEGPGNATVSGSNTISGLDGTLKSNV